MPVGFEPGTTATFRLLAQRSNQLTYAAALRNNKQLKQLVEFVPSKQS